MLESSAELQPGLHRPVSGDRHERRAPGSGCGLCTLDGRKGPPCLSSPVAGPVLRPVCPPGLDTPELERKDGGVELLAWSPFLGPSVPHTA